MAYTFEEETFEKGEESQGKTEVQGEGDTCGIREDTEARGESEEKVHAVDEKPAKSELKEERGDKMQEKEDVLEDEKGRTSIG